MDDIVAIQQTLNIYTEAVGRLDWPRVMSVYMPDAVWAFAGTPHRFEGAAAIEAGLQALLAPMAFLVQINAPAVIEVSGDRAKARATIREAGRFRDRPEAVEALGIYEDDLVRTQAGWRFTRRTFRPIGIYRTATLPDEPGSPA